LARSDNLGESNYAAGVRYFQPSGWSAATTLGDQNKNTHNPERVCQMSSIPVSEVEFVGFALGDCSLDLDPASAKYLRVVHGTALELAVHNQFGAEFGGFWLLSHQITQLRRLPEYYSPDEAPQVEFAIEAYLAAQIRDFKF